VPAVHLERAVDIQEGDAASVLAHYRRFLAFRKEHVALVKGEIAFQSAEGAILSFVRTHGNEKVFCAFNMSPIARLADLPDGTLQVLEGHGFESMMHAESIELPAWSGFFARFV
jgi:alpha-glucosidase